MIDWDAVLERGEQGLLTAREARALCELAESVRWWELEGDELRCIFCDGLHNDGCPVAVLEAVGE